MSSYKQQPFSESELEALGLWDVAEQFGKKTTRSVKQEETVSPTLTVEQIESMQQQAYDEAFAQGQQDGYQKGHAEGLKKGREQGFAEGRAEGLKKGAEENQVLIRQQLAQFVSLMEALSEPFNELDEQVEKELVNLAIGIASQVIRREIKVDPGQIVAVVREAVKALPLAGQKLSLHMHPEDAELIRSSLALDELSPPWNIIEEPLVTRGGCRVSTETSNIDATIENRLAAIVATILGGEREEDVRS